MSLAGTIIHGARLFYVHFHPSSSELNSKSKNTFFQLESDVIGDSEQTINGFYDNYSKSFNSNTYYFGCISHNVIHPILKGGMFLLEGFKATGSYEWQITTTYSTSGSVSRFCRSKINGEWKEWTPC